MPLADDVQSNFIYCIQSMQTNFMAYLLEPLIEATEIKKHLNKINEYYFLY